MKWHRFTAALLLLIVMLQSDLLHSATPAEVEATLSSYVEAWKGTEELDGQKEPIVLYFRITDLEPSEFSARLEPGMHVNEKPEDQTNPFKSLVIVIEGDLLGRLDGEVLSLEVGEAVVIPSGMRHEFWVEKGAAEFILLMFGEGA